MKNDKNKNDLNYLDHLHPGKDIEGCLEGCCSFKVNLDYEDESLLEKRM